MGLKQFFRCGEMRPHHEDMGMMILQCTEPFWHVWKGNKIHIFSVYNP